MAKKHSGLTGADLHNPKGIDALNTSTALVMSQSAQTIAVSGSVLPNATNTYDLGSAAKMWKDIYVSSGSIKFVDPTTNAVVATIGVDADGNQNISGSVLPDADATYDLGSSGKEWRNLYIDGTANIDSLTLTSGATVTGIDNGSLGSSATLLATQGAVKTYVDAQVTAQDLDATTDSGTIDIDLDSETLTIAGGEGIDTSATGTTITIAGEEASTSNKGVASFNSDNFSVSSGVVTIKDAGVILGTETTGNYVSTAVAGTGISVSGATGNVTISSAITAGDGLTLNTADIDIDAAQTVITSLFATDIKIGEDDETKIDFETANTINFYTGNEKQLILIDGALTPGANNILDLGASDNEFKNAYFDGTVTSDAFAGPLTGEVTGNASTATKISSITNSNIVQLTSSQTLTNKTLTTPTIVAAGWANANHTHAGSTTGGQITLGTGTTGNYVSTAVAGTGISVSGATGNVTITSAITAGDGLTLNTADIDIDASQTTLTSILNTALVTGRDSDNQVKYSTDDQIIFRVAGGDGVTFKASGEIEATSLDIEGDADINGTLEADAITVNGTALNTVIAGVTVSNATLAATTTVSDSTANTNFPIILHDESNGLLDDTGTFTYNPSTATLVVSNINVSGTQTFVDTATLVVTSSVIFEGATDDGHETTLTVVDPTTDRTWTLQNATDTIVGLATSDTLTNKTLTTPTIGSFTNATHTHADAAGGGQITLGTGTTGNYVSTAVAGTGISVSGATGNVTITSAITAGDGLTLNTADIDIDASQTTLTSILNTSLAVGRDSTDQIKFGTDNQIIFRVGNADGVTFKASGEIEATSLDISGDVDVDGTLETDALTIGGTTSVPFESGDHTKLDGIEASADVTDTTNVTSAGALMDSELTTIALVKGLAAGISDGNVLTANDAVADNDYLQINGTEVEGRTYTEVRSDLGIEAGATADQSNAEIVAAVEAGTDSNTFTDADHTKLNAIEASADVTDTTNVTAAGALMDSELTTIALVKGLTAGISDGNVLTANDVVADNDFLRINGTEVEGLTVAEVLTALSVESGATADQSNAEIRAAVAAATDSQVFTDADHTKLDGIEASADVTDTTNVTAAGALMDSELTTIALVKGLTAGIGDGNVLTANDVVADDDFLRISGTEVEGLTVAEVLTALSVESGADVTDTTNVTAAGALMDSELTSIAAVKAINQGLATGDDVTFGTVRVDDTTVASSKTTGALIVDGGIGVSLAGFFGGDVVAFASSDERLKDNIRPIESALFKVQQINGVTFDWNDKQSIYKGHDVGVIAQEVEKVLPEIVSTRDDGYKAVKYEKIVPLLIESIKELKQEIDDLKKKN